MNTITSKSNIALINSSAALPSTEKKADISPNSTNTSTEPTKTTVTLSDEITSNVNNDDQYIDPNLPKSEILLNISQNDKNAIYNKEWQEYGIDTKFSADAALTKLNREMVALQHKIEAIRPDMLGKKWDFVLNDGKIEVTSTNLKQDDKQWLENTLNRNKTVVGAVKDFYASVVKHFEHTQDHPSSFDNVNESNAYAYGVDEQINGKLEVKSITDRLVAKNKTATGAIANPFIDSMEIARSQLKMTDQPTYFHNTADMTDPTTAAYVKSHPWERV